MLGLNLGITRKSINKAETIPLSDPQFGQVSLLLPMANGLGNRPVDVSSSPKTLSGNTTIVTEGKFGTGATFSSGTNLEISSPPASLINLNNGYAFECWAKIDSDPGFYNLFSNSKNYNSGYVYFGFGPVGSNLQFYYWNGGSGYTVSGNIGTGYLGEWHHFGLAIYSSLITLYYDGVVVAQAGVIGSIQSSNWADFQVGCNNGVYLSGLMDDVRVTYGLPAREIVLPTSAYPLNA